MSLLLKPQLHEGIPKWYTVLLLSDTDSGQALLFPISWAWKLTDLSFSGLSLSTHYHQNNFLKVTSIPLVSCLKRSKAPQYFAGVCSCSRHRSIWKNFRSLSIPGPLCQVYVQTTPRQLWWASLVSKQWGLPSPPLPLYPDRAWGFLFCAPTLLPVDTCYHVTF